jgi:CBS-domain-containing membrane protein
MHLVTKREYISFLRMNPCNTWDQADMNPPGITDDATNLMNNKKIRKLVAVNRNNKMTGILTQRDILNKIVC